MNDREIEQYYKTNLLPLINANQLGGTLYQAIKTVPSELSKNDLSRLWSHIVDGWNNQAPNIPNHMYYPLADEFKRLVSPEEKNEILKIITKKIKDKILEFNKLEIDKLERSPFFWTAFKTLTDAEKTRYDQIKSAEDPTFIQDMLSQFRKKDYITFGQIEYTGGLLTIAEHANRKQYSVNPVVLRSKEEFIDFLNILKMIEPPARERFIITGAHWVCGDVKISQDGQFEILFIDSLGVGNLSRALFKQVNEIFPNGKIYYDDTERQKSQKGCSMFALGDALRLFTIEQYLKEIEYDDLFDFLSREALSPAKEIPLIRNAIATQIPAAFLQTTQTAALYEKRSSEKAFLDNRTLTMRLGKKKPTAQEWVLNLSAKGFTNQYGQQTGRNTRLEQELSKIADRNEQFLLNTSTEEIQEIMEKFTLSGFEKRVLEAKKQEETKPILKHFEQAIDRGKNDPEEEPSQPKMPKPK